MPNPTCLTEMILHDQANHYGTLFRGQGLSLMAKAAFVAASRPACARVVLTACHDARFSAPVPMPMPMPMGSLFVQTAEVIHVGRSSTRIQVSGTCEQPGTHSAPRCAGHIHHGRGR